MEWLFEWRVIARNPDIQLPNLSTRFRSLLAGGVRWHGADEKVKVKTWQIAGAPGLSIYGRNGARTRRTAEGKADVRHMPYASLLVQLSFIPATNCVTLCRIICG
jgi:hypothetical protein